jgi:DNA-binding beta-propeller fold protein YncE
MNTPLVDSRSNPERFARWSRLLMVSAAAVLAGATAVAQSVGISTAAGQAGSSGVTNANGTLARFNLPAGLASDGTSIYIADASNNAIRKLLISTGDVTTMATGFSAPGAVAVDGSGNAFVADSSNHAIKKVTSGGVVTVQAGANGVSGVSSVTSVTMTNARFNSPQGVAVNSAGTIVYVADTGNNVVRRIDIGGDSVTEIATGFKPWGLALNAAGTVLYVADYTGHTIRSITFGAPDTLATVAGTLNTQGSTDSPALFRFPQALTVDSAGDLYVADTGNHIIRKISGATVTTLAGQAGSIGSTDALGTSARFNGPAGIVATAVNTFYIADSNNHTIRRGAPAVAPAITSANNTAFAVGAAGTFTVTATGSPAPTFSVTGTLPSGVTLNATTGVLSGTPSSSAGSPFVVTITATNGVSPNATQTFTLTVNQPPAITSANSTTFAVNVAGSFTVTATGSPAPTFSYTGSFPPWASLNTLTGAITGTPLNSSGSPFSFTVIATNGVGSPATQPFSLTVNNGAGIGTHPSDQTALLGATATFTVVATGTPAPTYQWERQPAGGFSYSPLSESSTYIGTTSASLFVTNVQASMNGDRFRVVVNNGVGSAVTSNAATLIFAQVPAITSAAAATFVVNQAGSFTVTATGSPAPTFSYSGTFPPWASLNTTTGAITGTPTSTVGSPFAFTLTATNGIAPAATQNFVLTVSLANAAAAISTQPVDLTVQLGQTATFSAAATGTPAPTLRWQRQPSGTAGYVDLTDDGTYSGTTGNTLTVTNPVAGMSGDRLRLVASNTVNGIPITVASTGALLTVNIGTAITTFAGTSGTSGTVDGTGTAARFNTPASIAVDSSGNFYVADAANNVIRKINSGGVVTTLAGQPGASGNIDGEGSAARFNGPSALTVDAVGNVYVTDTYNHTIRVVTPSGSVSTVAGLANNIGFADGTGNLARFSFPAGITVDGSGTLYVSDTSNHTIRRIALGGVVTTLAGSPGSSGNTNGLGATARFSYPNGIAVTNAGLIYVADSFNHVIRRVTLAGDVTTIAGGAGSPGSTDANGLLARFNQPTGVAADTVGNLYVADTYNNTIRKITAAGDVSTLAGAAGLQGSADGVGSEARFYQPFSVTVTTGGNVYIADTRNHSIRRSGTTTAPGIQTQPVNRTVPAGGTTTFAVVATGVPQPSYQWQRQPANTSGFNNLTNDSFYSGVTTSTLTLNNVLSTASGDQFRVVVSNGITPSAVSDGATLTIGESPVITSAATASFRATQSGSFTVTATGSPTPTFSGTDLPSWLSINPQTGVLSGTPPESAVGQVAFTVLATNGSTVTQSFTLVVTPAIVAPTFQTQPTGVAVNQGQSATFSVSVQGTGPLTYQWFKNGGAINSATGASLTIANAQIASAGSFSVRVTNAAGSAVSNGVALVVNTIPVFSTQPRSQAILAGGTVTFNVAATGGTAFTYQWRRNGVAILGANSANLTIAGVTGADAGLYDVIVASGVGPAVSSVAELTVVSAPVAPVISVQPASRTVIAGTATTLTVVASGVPAPSYQWRRNGGDIPGAVGASYSVASAQASDAGTYQVVVNNGIGSVTSAAAIVQVASRSYAGYYFGTFSGGNGNFALYVREDNSGVFLGFLPGATAQLMSLNVAVNDAGSFVFSQGAILTGASDVSGPVRAAALAPVVVSGTIGNDGNLTGNVIGGASLNLSASRVGDGATAGLAGYYQAGSSTNGTAVYSIVSPNGQSFAVLQSGSTSDGGIGIASSNGTLSVATARSTFTATLSGASGSLTGNTAGAIVSTVTGGTDAALARQRLVNISSRARVAGGDSVAIAGFVISGEESKPVLIRAVGPTLGAAPFNVPGVLAAPRLELFRGPTSLAVNAGIAGNRAAIDAASIQAGAFALGAAGTDAAIFTTLAPGNYTAIVSGSAANAAGVVLVEVYDLSATNSGQKLLNIATRAAAGANENTLIAGFVIPAGTSKRVLIRGVGPGLTPFGVTGVLAQPVLALLSGGTTVAQNTNWNSSPDSALISTTSAQVGAFALSNNDSALIATLAPGNYTAQVTGVGGGTGIALIEVYELP